MTPPGPRIIPGASISFGRKSVLIVLAFSTAAVSCRTAPVTERPEPGDAREISRAEYFDKVHAAWLGAAIGGALGMSVEGMHKNEIETFLKELGQWPLTDYIPTVPPQRKGRTRASYVKDAWEPAGFGPDDDTLYQVANLLLLEEKGLEISSADIADKWLGSFSVFEAQNCGRAVRVAEERLKQGIRPPESGRHEKGEYMGGQMKGEFWGYLAPGNPPLAAEYGRRDAEVAFRDNGVWGEMFMAAVVSEAFFESDSRKLLESGLRVIPADCDYARCIRDVISWHEQWPDDWEKTQAEIDRKWAPEGDQKDRRVFPNNAVNALALLYGNGDFGRTIAIAVMAGWDTDTNAGDVGPVLGVILGTAGIAEKWRKPIADTFRCDVRGAESWRISELARRTAEMGVRMTSAKSPNVRITQP